MKIFITGATGFVGRALSKALSASGHEVYCLVRDFKKAESILPPSCRLVQGDIKQLDHTAVEVMNSCEALYHLAACVASSTTKEFFCTNVDGTKNLLKQLSGVKLKAFVFLSSLAVVGDYRASENQCRPFSPYGKSKWMAENVIRDYFSDHVNIKCIMVRSPVVYGEDQPLLVTDFFQRIKRNKIKLPGDGSNIRRMCYIGNLIKGLIGCLTYTTKNNCEVINIADKEAYSLRSLAENISEKMTGSKVQIKQLPSALASVALMIYKLIAVFGFNVVPLFVLGTTKANIDCDMSKTNAEKTLAAEYSFEQGMDRTIKWLESKKLLGPYA